MSNELNDRFEYLKEHYLPRFWDIENKRMVYPECNNYGLEDKIEYQQDKYNKVSLTHLLMVMHDRFIPMKPCGGLKDKHGTLMYEKDTANYGGTKDLTIEWFDGGFHFVQYSGLTRPKTQPLSESNLSTVEIIGNIHTKGDSDE